MEDFPWFFKLIICPFHAFVKIPPDLFLAKSYAKKDLYPLSKATREPAAPFLQFLIGLPGRRMVGERILMPETTPIAM